MTRDLGLRYRKTRHRTLAQDHHPHAAHMWHGDKHAVRAWVSMLKIAPAMLYISFWRVAAGGGQDSKTLLSFSHGRQAQLVHCGCVRLYFEKYLAAYTIAHPLIQHFKSQLALRVYSVGSREAAMVKVETQITNSKLIDLLCESSTAWRRQCWREKRGSISTFLYGPLGLIDLW